MIRMKQELLWTREAESFPIENSPHVQELTDEEYAAVKPEESL